MHNQLFRRDHLWQRSIHVATNPILIFADENKLTTVLTSKEIKCPNCGEWTPGDKSYCQHCGELVDPEIIDRRERDKRKQEHDARSEASKSKLERYLDKLQHSENPFKRMLFKVLNVIWMIYMGIVSFVIWFTTIFSG